MRLLAIGFRLVETFPKFFYILPAPLKVLIVCVVTPITHHTSSEFTNITMAARSERRRPTRRHTLRARHVGPELLTLTGHIKSTRLPPWSETPGIFLLTGLLPRPVLIWSPILPLLTTATRPEGISSLTRLSWRLLRHILIWDPLLALMPLSARP